MMFLYSFLPKLLNMSLTASVAIVLVLLLRFLLKRSPKVISYALWSIVLVRLLCPISIKSHVSLFGLLDPPVTESGVLTSRIEYVPSDIVPAEHSNQLFVVDDVVPAVIPQGAEHSVFEPLAIAAYIWMAGVCAMGIYAALAYCKLRKRLITASPLRDNIYLADGISSPFVMGLFRPKIYLPSAIGEREQSYILLHEQHHIRRLDHIMKALAFIALCIHWFNPLAWVAFIMAGKDMEMSCDEAVVKRMGEGVLADYAASLLSLATGRHSIAGMPLAFGEGDPKGRIRNLAAWKKPTFWVVLVAVIACVVLAVCLLTNPAANIRNPWVQEYTPGAVGILGNVDKESFESISGDFAIGADEYGRAVFKTPEKAFDTMLTLYAEGLALIQENNDLPPINRRNYSDYKTFGWQTTFGSAAAQEQATFITKFLDIYENSFEKEPPERKLTKLLPGTTYVSYQCIYMNPLSSVAAFGGDSGYQYMIGEDYFAAIHRSDGAISSMVNRSAGTIGNIGMNTSNRTDIEHWEWKEFPYTDEAWAALFFPGVSAVENIHEQYQEILYQPLTELQFLLRVDGDLWLAELKNNPQMGTYLWSIYSLIPENAMGTAQ